MDLLTVTDLVRPETDDDLRRRLAATDTDTALLGGGTWLFSTPQTGVRRLVDLTGCGWRPIRDHDDVLEIAGTATLAELAGYADRTGNALVRGCCEALVGSAKIWNVATVGGNIALALPAGPMITLTTVLDADALVWAASGGERRIAVSDLVLGTRCTALRPGEVLRAVEIPTAALSARTALRKASLAPLGRSAALLAGRRDPDGALVLVVTAAVDRPVVLRWPSAPTPAELDDAVDALGDTHGWYDDPHGTPAWRRAMTRRLAREIRHELAGERP
jgi:CO/xanthine dehydrogenase FAD-binding subunit